ncbi:hypothetical protein UK23_21680 [Lentzea aerocolonigenes]|uniref:Secreted protein n=1 Tax=Lentzea aerocolonigenes TaxID=68170 RepID=A0A0F0GUL8_LENAE|nr:hypothetical protein [Lentzea aerocolonigenes]KJK46970.1 hypothetical protein UK23_21680 [Lentzea aerocolonigenes]
MRLTNGVVRKGLVILSLAAAATAVSSLPAQAGRTDWLRGPERTAEEFPQHNDFADLAALCKKQRGTAGQRLVDTPNGNLQAVLECKH